MNSEAENFIVELTKHEELRIRHSAVTFYVHQSNQFGLVFYGTKILQKYVDDLIKYPALITLGKLIQVSLIHFN